MPQGDQFLPRPDEQLYLDYGPKVMRYIFASNLVTGKTVLDVRCGLGYGTEILVDGGAKEVIGGDIGHPSIRFAKENYDYDKGVVHFLVFDAVQMPFLSNSFDIIVCFELIEHLWKPEQEQLLFECRRVLREEGIFLCSTPNKETSTPWEGKNVHHHWTREHVGELTPQAFQDLLGKYFVEVRLFGGWRMNILERIQVKYVDYFLGEKVYPRMPRGIRSKIGVIRRLLNSTLYRKRGPLKDVTHSKFGIQPYEEGLHQRNLIALCGKTRGSEAGFSTR